MDHSVSSVKQSTSKRIGSRMVFEKRERQLAKKAQEIWRPQSSTELRSLFSIQASSMPVRCQVEKEEMLTEKIQLLAKVREQARDQMIENRDLLRSSVA